MASWATFNCALERRCVSHDQLRISNQASDSFDVGSGDAVFFEVRNDGANGRVGAGYGWAGFERETVVETLRGAHHFYGQDEFEVGCNLAKLERAGHAHGDVVFFTARCRDGIRAGGMGEDFALIEQSRCRYVGDHVSRRETGIGAKKGWEAFVDVGVDEAVDTAFADAGEVGEGDGGVVEGVAEGCAVEVAA